ncbi:hypothetical protein BHM03_00051780 [Ensete ventricosum]|nr:hypothetical protein BHM03_00051780 [Ensete ventricosum]
MKDSPGRDDHWRIQTPGPARLFPRSSSISPQGSVAVLALEPTPVDENPGRHAAAWRDRQGPVGSVPQDCRSPPRSPLGTSKRKTHNVQKKEAKRSASCGRYLWIIGEGLAARKRLVGDRVTPVSPARVVTRRETNERAQSRERERSGSSQSLCDSRRDGRLHLCCASRGSRFVAGCITEINIPKRMTITK